MSTESNVDSDSYRAAFLKSQHELGEQRAQSKLEIADLKAEIERMRAENERKSREVRALDGMVDQFREELTLANESNAIMRTQLLEIDKRNAK